MKSLFNSRGAAFIPFLLAVGILFGWSAYEVKKNWKAAQPKVEKVRYYIAKDIPMAPDKEIIDITIPMPAKEGE